MRTAQWARTVGPAVLDEAQKEPGVFDKVKYAFDAGELDFTVLLGSSRFLLLDRVRETLAGRAFLYELWPLMASEVRTAATDGSPAAPLIDDLLRSRRRIDAVLIDRPEVEFGDDDELRRAALDHLASWGGMPELLRLEDDARHEWLRSYQQTFLERDLADLVRLSDLQPFRRLQELCMLRTANLLRYANLARDADLAPTTARRYLEYLQISYQILTLPPFHTNLTSARVKTPKLYWVDLGLLRRGTRQWGALTGAMYETLVVGEIHKWVQTTGVDAGLSFYRSRSGMEVDLLIETPHGVLGLEVKQSRHPSKSARRRCEPSRRRSAIDGWVASWCIPAAG